jgi:L-lactate utilization protein LutC
MHDGDVMEKVRRALGRSGPLAQAPIPPEIPDPITRLVHTELGLSELFSKVAKENKMLVEQVYVEELGAKVAGFLMEQGCRRIGMPKSAFLEKLGVYPAMASAGLDVKLWPQISLDESYELDAGVTDVWAAVAETGSLIIRPTPDHGRALSLVPMVHVAIVQPKDIVPDLVDLMEKMAKDDGAAVIITGPSKTADIEMQLVQGVHGPGVVKVFVLG